jgi:putative transposase
MIRTLKIKLDESNDLLQTVRVFNLACQIVLDYGFAVKDYNKTRLNRAIYKTIREKYPILPSALVQTARDQASDMLKRDKFKHKITKKLLSSIRYDNRTMKIFLESGRASLSTLFGRLTYNFQLPDYYKQYATWEIKNAQLLVKKGICYLHIQVEADNPESILNDTRIGIDLGINNIAICSDNSFYNSKHLKNVKGKYQHLKAELQSKGTRSAKRKLKKISGRERRFVTDLNHCLSKELVHKPYNTFVMEDLTGITKENKGHRFNKKLGNWSFSQLQNFVNYKSEGLNKNVIYIKPQYTSQTCSKCGYVAKNNRNGNKFKCKQCNFQLDADLNASRNIVAFSKSSSNWVSINHPIVTLSSVVTSPHPLEVGN